MVTCMASIFCGAYKLAFLVFVSVLAQQPILFFLHLYHFAVFFLFIPLCVPITVFC